jgi:heme-degrading monooxygenase HmoA
MAYIVTQCTVQDFAAFKQAFAAGVELRNANGSRGSRGVRIFQNPSDPSKVVLLSEWEDLERARQFLQSSELRESQQQAGVQGRPDLYEEVAFFPV